jgi:hypothetical protein
MKTIVSVVLAIGLLPVAGCGADGGGCGAGVAL